MYIGVDIGGTKCAVTIADKDAVIKGKIRFDTIPENPSANIDNIQEAINKLKKGAITAIGVSCGGPLNSKKGIIMSPPNLPGWDYIHIVDIMQKEFNAPAFLQNDANACALAEWKFGAGRGCQNMVFLTFGSGMGAGLILDGRLYSGASDMAGELGHVRMADEGPVGYGKAGSFEGFCSGGGIAQIAYNTVLEKIQRGERVGFCNDLPSARALSAKDVAIAAENGDETAIEIYNKCGQYLGKGLAILVDILNPERIVIGGIFTRSRNLLWSSASEVLKKESLRFAYECCEVVPAALGEEIGDVAAISVGINGYEEK
ncbi:MAG: ROK family protein [Oscillospiraceae bacterium]|nr:ROK family protein [Oscillospiraceae bacterium]